MNAEIVDSARGGFEMPAPALGSAFGKVRDILAQRFAAQLGETTHCASRLVHRGPLLRQHCGVGRLTRCPGHRWEHGGLRQIELVRHRVHAGEG